MLRGESPRSLATPTQVAGVPAFDWRELQRWGIGEDRLEPGSVVLFREPTAWQRYRRQIIVAAALASVQALIVDRAGGKSRQHAAWRSRSALSEERFRLLSNAAPVMMWSAGPDKARIDVNRSRLDYTGQAAEPGSGNGWTDAIHPDDLRVASTPTRRHSTAASPSRRSTASAVMTANTDGSSTLERPDLRRRPLRATSGPRST